jgi:HEAT repeat protein
MLSVRQTTWLLAWSVLLLAGCNRQVSDDETPTTIPTVVSPEQIREVRARQAALQLASAKKTPVRQPLFKLNSLPDFRRWTVRETAVDALARIGEDAVAPLVQTLSDPDPEARASAARALSRMGPTAEPAVPALIVALKDEDRDVRQSAARALGQIGPGAHAAIPALIEAMRESETTVDATF